MANALTSRTVGLQINVIHQFLHGYSEGHRLIEGSLKLPDDLARLVLRMSDLSGSSVVRGFDQYITGYPLGSINAYALAMTWYASEMPRPGCVWTHTLVLAAPAMAEILSLSSLRHLFKRPARGAMKGQYAEALSLDGSLNTSQRGLHPDVKGAVSRIFSAYYQSPRFRPVVLVAQDSDEFTDAIFALWSQQWPTLREQFAFCTGSLSARTLPDRPFDIQCSPPAFAKDVAREATSDALAEPMLVPNHGDFFSEDLMSAINDALIPDGGPFRDFLWTVADANSSRADFASYVKVFDAFNRQTDPLALVELIAQIFPEPTTGTALKAQLLGNLQSGPLRAEYAVQNILRALATTDKYASFDSGALLNEELIAKPTADSRHWTRQLVDELFHSNLNPLGDELLTKLVRAMDAEGAQQLVSRQPQLLPAIFRANPGLAASHKLWSLAGDRKRELLDSLVAQEIRPELVSQIVFALLESGSDGFIRRVFERWGKDAVFAALDWTESHQGSMLETCRGALTFRVPEVMAWVESGAKSPPALTAVAHVVAPYSCQIAKYDSTVWLTTLRYLQKNGQHEEATYVRTFLLALGLCNAPPAPLDLISESFELIHAKAEKQQLGDNEWMILQPLVPELSWWKNWDKCERMRRALVSAFMKYHWPAWELKERVTNRKILGELLDSVRKVDGEHYFSNSRRS
jgi:hypothetical protein